METLMIERDGGWVCGVIVAPPPLSQQSDGLRKCSVKINVETYFSWILNISLDISIYLIPP